RPRGRPARDVPVGHLHDPGRSGRRPRHQCAVRHGRERSSRGVADHGEGAGRVHDPPRGERVRAGPRADVRPADGREAEGVTDEALGAWFLSSAERGNSSTAIDRWKPDGSAWTEANRADPLVHGATYFARLLEVISGLRDGDRVHFTDWRGDWDERLDGPGTEVGVVLRDAAKRGVEVLGLV